MDYPVRPRASHPNATPGRFRAKEYLFHLFRKLWPLLPPCETEAPSPPMWKSKDCFQSSILHSDLSCPNAENQDFPGIRGGWSPNLGNWYPKSINRRPNSGPAHPIEKIRVIPVSGAILTPQPAQSFPAERHVSVPEPVQARSASKRIWVLRLTRQTL